MDATEFYHRVGRLIEKMPQLAAYDKSPETLKWYGDAYALISAHGDGMSAIALQLAIDKLTQSSSRGVLAVQHANEAADAIRVIMYRILSIAEMNAPNEHQGSFIAAGSTFDAFAAITKVLSMAKNEVLIIDPYMDEKILTDFAISLDEHINIKLLTCQKKKKQSLEPALSRWKSQYINSRLLEARATESTPLHDRLIIIDNIKVWVLTQSLNAFAKNAHAAVVEYPDTDNLKKQSYVDIWNSSISLTNGTDNQ